MNLDSHILLRLTTCFLLSMAFYAAAAQSTSAPAAQPNETRSTNRARGPFDVKTTAQALSEKVADPTLGRMSLDKQYHGDLEASGKGEMLTVSTGVKGSGVYVAVERVTGTPRPQGQLRALPHRSNDSRHPGIKNHRGPRFGYGSAGRSRRHIVDSNRKRKAFVRP